jgi:hypothetical protein
LPDSTSSSTQDSRVIGIIDIETAKKIIDDFRFNSSGIGLGRTATIHDMMEAQRQKGWIFDLGRIFKHYVQFFPYPKDCVLVPADFSVGLDVPSSTIQICIHNADLLKGLRLFYDS